MYCECGCGQITKIAKRNLYDRGILKGESLRFVHGHNRRKPNYKKETTLMCELYENENSISMISEKMNLSKGMIKHRLKKEGVSRDRIEAVKLASRKGLIPRPGNTNPCSEETKRKLSQRFKGSKLAEKRKNPGSCRENHWNWKGGITDTISKLRQTEEYKRWRSNVYKRDHYTCQMCGKKKDIVAHHILSFTKYPFGRFLDRNGITLCRSCHKKVHENIGSKTRFKSKDHSRLHHDLKNPRTEVTITWGEGEACD